MAKARLLQTVCAVALLAAAPAFAQTDTRSATTGAGNTPNAPMANDSTTSGGTGYTAQSSTMSPATTTDSRSEDSSAPTGGHSTYRTAQASHSRSRTDTSQNGEVDRLNEQSYQAAQRG